jgi:hypothetical protein
MRTGRAVPSFSVRPEKEAKGAVLHGTSAAERSRHVKNCSANLPKRNASRRFKHMERVPHRATQIVAAGAASASPSKPLLPLFTDAMVSRLNRTLYKGRQFAKNYEEAPGLDEADFQRMKRQMGNHLP